MFLSFVIIFLYFFLSFSFFNITGKYLTPKDKTESNNNNSVKYFPSISHLFIYCTGVFHTFYRCVYLIATCLKAQRSYSELCWQFSNSFMKTKVRLHLSARRKKRFKHQLRICAKSYNNIYS